jgi:hypothetical protein
MAEDVCQFLVSDSLTADACSIWMAALPSNPGTTIPSSCSGGGGFNCFGGYSSNAQPATTTSVGFGDFHAIPATPTAPAQFNSFANPSLTDASSSEGFGSFVSVEGNAARAFPVSFGGEGSSDLLVGFDSNQVTPAVQLITSGRAVRNAYDAVMREHGVVTATACKSIGLPLLQYLLIFNYAQVQTSASITPAKAAVASLVNLENLNISAKEVQAASAASGAVRTLN